MKSYSVPEARISAFDTPDVISNSAMSGFSVINSDADFGSNVYNIGSGFWEK